MWLTWVRTIDKINVSPKDTKEDGKMNISVKAARKQKGLTQEEVAKGLGLSLNGYKRKELGERRFYIDEISHLSKILGVEIQNFFETSCPKKTQN